eukprot:gene33460-41287_t
MKKAVLHRFDGNAQAHALAGVVGHDAGVVAAAIVVGHFIAVGARFPVVHGAALFHRLLADRARLGVLVVDAVAHHGAGKTTCFNLLTKFLTPTSGAILYNGQDITGLKPERIADRGVIRSFQISAVFPHLTVLENVRIGLQRALGTSFHFWKSERTLNKLNERARELLATVDLERFADTVTADLPYGRKRALEIATTLAMEPELMLLDEPTQGMGHEDVHRVTELIKKVSANRTILMVEHNMSVVSGICDKISVLQRGALLAEGSYDEVSNNPQRGRIGRSALMGTPALEIRNLQAWYGESHILHGVDFEIRRGELVTLLGRNGAGKTTTLRSIMGILGKRTGSITFEGRETIGMTSDYIARLGIAYCPGERGIFSSLNVDENLRLPPVVKPGGLSIEEIYKLFPNLLERRYSQGTKLSGGEQQMLAIGRILRTGATLLLLDEPTEGLAPVIVQRIGDVLKTLKARGMTVLLVEQNFRFASKVADRFYLMDHGRMVGEFPVSELSARMDMLHDVLGV